MPKKERVPFCKNRDGSINYTTDRDGCFLFADKDGTSIRLDMFDGHYYKLRPWNGVPILEIDGLRMQLVRDFKTPLEYSKEVVAGLKIPKSVSKPEVSHPSGSYISVLDTCMGLGYTALAAASSSSVDNVVTCELSKAVISLAQWNPLSEQLFEKSSSNKVTIMEGNVVDIIKNFTPATFDFVIHDPPRFTHAPELYSLPFYTDLYSACKAGSRIFHYVGSLGKGKGRSIKDGVSLRLTQAGFRNFKYSDRLQGLFAEKLL